MMTWASRCFSSEASLSSRPKVREMAVLAACHREGPVPRGGGPRKLGAPWIRPRA